MADKIYSIMKPVILEFRDDLFEMIDRLDDREMILCLEDSKLYYKDSLKVYEVGKGEVI